MLAFRIVMLLTTVAFIRGQEDPTFRADVQRVLVPVIVRDGDGRVVSDLTPDNFRLLDEGKLKEIVEFNVERGAQFRHSVDRASAIGSAPGRNAGPSRFLVYFLDDRNISFQDLEQARKALERYLKAGLPAGTLASLFTSSGVALPFTDDSQAVLAALLGISPTVSTQNQLGCPEISYYLADLIINRRDPSAIGAAVNQLYRCGAPPGTRQAAVAIVQTQAEKVLQVEAAQANESLRMFAEALARLVSVRGERELIFVSTGLQLVRERRQFEGLLDRAVTHHIRVNALNAHGVHGVNLYLDPGVPVESFTVAALRWRSDTLATMADTTGGRYIHQDNDVEHGLRQLTDEPRTVYFLGFRPSTGGKPGEARKLKVEVVGRRGLQVQARRSYVPNVAAPTDIQRAREALMSVTDVRQLQVFVTANSVPTATTVTAHVQADNVMLQPCGNHLCNTITFVFGVFDEHGVLINEVVRKAELRLDAAGKQAIAERGIQVSAEFPSTPPRYRARVAVVEARGGLAGTNTL